MGDSVGGVAAASVRSILGPTWPRPPIPTDPRASPTSGWSRRSTRRLTRPRRCEQRLPPQRLADFARNLLRQPGPQDGHDKKAGTLILFSRDRKSVV